MQPTDYPLHSLRSLWQRRNYCTLTTWAMAIYDHLLNSRIGLEILPFRGLSCAARLHEFSEPFIFRLGTSDWMVLDEMYVRRHYEFVLGKGIRDCRVVVDLGANVGYSIRIWAQAFPNATLIGVEPDIGNLRICHQNIANFASRCKLIQAFVGALPGYAQIDRSGAEWAFKMATHNTVGNDNVRVITVPELLTHFEIDQPIDLLKCDIEGAERDLFSADCSWLGNVRTAIVELHGDYTPERFLQDIRKCGTEFGMTVVSRGPDYAVVYLRRESTRSSGNA